MRGTAFVQLLRRPLFQHTTASKGILQVRGIIFDMAEYMEMVLSKDRERRPLKRPGALSK